MLFPTYGFFHLLHALLSKLARCLFRVNIPLSIARVSPATASWNVRTAIPPAVMSLPPHLLCSLQ